MAAVTIDAPNFVSSNSFAKVARYHALFLRDRGHQVRILARCPERAPVAVCPPHQVARLDGLRTNTIDGTHLVYCGPGDLRSAPRSIFLVPFETATLRPGWSRHAQAVRHLATHSHASRQALLLAGVAPDKVSLIHHGFDPTLYYPGAEPLFPMDGAFTFLFIGHFNPRKGIDRLVRAFVDTFGRDDDVRLRIVTQPMFGQGRPQARIAALASGSPVADRIDVRIQPFNAGIPEQEMARVYASGHCLVFPSLGEGFGLPALEARACGLEVIATRCGGLVDFLNHCNAHLVDVEAMRPDPACESMNPVYRGLHFWVPSSTSLRQRMREVYEGARKPGGVEGWTWDERLDPLARLVERHGEAEVRRPPVRTPPAPEPQPLGGHEVPTVWLCSFRRSGNHWLQQLLARNFEGIRTTKAHVHATEVRSMMGPHDRLVYLVRDPKDVLASNYEWARESGEAHNDQRSWVIRPDTPSSFLRRPRRFCIGSTFERHQSPLARHHRETYGGLSVVEYWKSHVQDARAMEAGGSLFMVRYEDLLHHLEPTLDRLGRWLERPVQRPVDPVREPVGHYPRPDRSRRTIFCSEEIEHIESQLGSVTTPLGYRSEQSR